MPKLAKELSAIQVKRLDKPGLHFVGGVPGLALQVTAGGARSWVFRVAVGGRRRDMGLGAYPSVMLAQARDKAREARELIRNGVDPVERQQAAVAALRAAAAAALTFRECAEKYIAAHRAGWRNTKHAGQWQATLATYAYPVIGDLRVRDIELAHVMKVLEPIWKTKTETASRLRGRIESVLDWATARGYRSKDNPARWRGHLDKLLPAASKVAQVKHHTALPAADIGTFMEQLRLHEGMGARALEFAILTAARSGEVRGARWSEIDPRKKLWSIPATRMKAGREHRVPLSGSALRLLESLPRMAGTDLVFPAPRGGVLSDMTLSAVLRRMGVDAVPHGFRSTFRDWAAECTSYPREVCEMALAHVVAGGAEAAYWRGDLFEKRRRLMQDWAKFLDMPRAKGKVITLRGAA